MYHVTGGMCTPPFKFSGYGPVITNPHFEVELNLMTQHKKLPLNWVNLKTEVNFYRWHSLHKLSLSNKHIVMNKEESVAPVIGI